MSKIKIVLRARPAECAGSAGGKEGSKPSGVCKTFCKILHEEENHAKSFAKEFMQSDGLRLARRKGAADLIAPRIPPGPAG